MRGSSSSGAWMVLAAGAWLAAGSIQPLSAQEVRYSGSLGFLTGSYYLPDRTHSATLLSGVGLSWGGRSSLTLSLPLVFQSSDAVSLLGGGMMPTGRSSGEGSMEGHVRGGMGGAGEERPRTGGSFRLSLGDPLIRGSHVLYVGPGSLRSFALVGSVKAPLAPVSSGVGTGEWDLGAGVSAVGAARGTLLLGGLTVWRPGRFGDLPLRDYGELTLGVGRSFSGRWTLLSSLNLSTQVIDGIDAPASLGLSLAHRREAGPTLMGGTSVGLSEAAADFSVFLGWSLTILGEDPRSRGGDRPSGSPR